MPSRLWGLLLVCLVVAACQTRGSVRPLSSDIEPPPRLATPPAVCRSAEAAFALGRHITAPLLEEMRERTGARMARTVAEKDPAAPAFDSMRLTVDIEPDGRIVGVRCG